MLISSGIQAQDKGSWISEINLRTGFYHVGSYSKENPSFFFEPEIYYRVLEKIDIGFGAGINLYPATLAYPIFLRGKYHFNIASFNAYISQSYGVNLRLGNLSFFSHRYTGGFGNYWLDKEKWSLLTGVKYLLLLDHYGGRNIGFLANIGIRLK